MKKIAIILMAITLVTNLCACQKSNEADSNVAAVVTISPQDNEAYEKVCDKHVTKLKKHTPQLVKKYNLEAKSLKSQGFSKEKLEKKLEELYRDTLSELANINAKGVTAMVGVKSTAVNEVGFQEWTNELYSAYAEEAGKISEAYHQSLK